MQGASPPTTPLLSEAGIEPAISRLEVGRDIHFATRTQGTCGSPEPLPLIMGFVLMLNKKNLP